jgi:hypothetical protein
MEGLISLPSTAMWVLGVFLLACTIVLIMLRERRPGR